MDSATYSVWNKLKALSANNINTYYCGDLDDVRRINELVNAGYITVSWKTARDVVFYIAEEAK